METAFSRISNVVFYDRVIAGLLDDNDIRALCNLMLSKLIVIDYDETVRRLDAIAECYRAVLSTKLKDTAVKQEIEKQEEANKSILRVTILLHEKTKSSLGAGHGGAGQVWASYYDWVARDFAQQVKGIREESKETRGVGPT